MSMNKIHLMAIRPKQIKEAVGEDRVKIVKGNRQRYNERQARIRRGEEKESDPESEDDTTPRKIWKCTDVACGGGIFRRMSGQEPVMINTECQTDPVDISHYVDTLELLNLEHMTVLTARPRDIQDGIIRPIWPERSGLSISHQGSLSSTGSQTNPKRSKVARFFIKRFTRVKDFIVSLFRPHPLLPKESSSEEDWFEENRRERDNEWMRDGSPERSQDDMQAAYEQAEPDLPPVPIPVGRQCYMLMSILQPFWWFMKLGGRWPFQTYIEDRIIKFRFNRWAPAFLLFVLTTLFLITCTAQGVINIFRIANSKNSTHSYNGQVEKIQFDKYWQYAFLTFGYSAYVIVWSVATIFDDGRFLADFMTRWNFGIVAINYFPFESVKWAMWWSLGWLLFYSSSLIIFFIFNLVPAVRGTSDLLGILILRGLATEARITEYFSIVRIFGLCFHLYAAYTARMITLWVILYCKFLENLARRWNLRFCYVFGMLGRLEGTDRYITYHTVIPLTKLFTEHKHITAFSRYTGKIFSVALTTYFLLKGMEMIMLAYRFITYLVFNEVKFSESHVPCHSLAPNCEQIAYRDSRVFVVMSVLYLAGQSICGWFMTTESITDCGQAIMSGFNFVRRYGLPRCNNAKERRFIQSLTFTYSPAMNYFINIGLVINRKFTLGMFSWVVVFTSLLLAFSPFQLQTQLITVCGPPINDTITCYTTEVKRSQRDKFLEESQGKVAGGKYYIQEKGPMPDLRPSAPPPVTNTLTVQQTVPANPQVPPSPNPQVPPATNPQPPPPTNPQVPPVAIPQPAPPTNPQVPPVAIPQPAPPTNPQVPLVAIPQPPPPTNPQVPPVAIPQPPPPANPQLPPPARDDYYYHCPSAWASKKPSPAPTVTVAFGCEKGGNTDIRKEFPYPSIDANGKCVWNKCYDKNRNSISPKPYPLDKDQKDKHTCGLTEGEVFSCGTKIDPTDRDHCGNLAFTKLGNTKLDKKAVIMEFPGKGDFKVCCCYDYHWYRTAKMKVQDNYCNTGSREHAAAACGNSCKKLDPTDHKLVAGKYPNSPGIVGLGPGVIGGFPCGLLFMPPCPPAPTPQSFSRKYKCDLAKP